MARSYDCLFSTICNSFKDEEVLQLVGETNFRRKAIQRINNYIDSIGGQEEKFMDNLRIYALPNELVRDYRFLSNLRALYSQIIKDSKKSYISQIHHPSVQLKLLIEKMTVEGFESNFYYHTFNNRDNWFIESYLKSINLNTQLYIDLETHDYQNCTGDECEECPIKVLAPYIEKIGKEKFEELQYKNALPEDVCHAYSYYIYISTRDIFD